MTEPPHPDGVDAAPMDATLPLPLTGPATTPPPGAPAAWVADEPAPQASGPWLTHGRLRAMAALVAGAGAAVVMAGLLDRLEEPEPPVAPPPVTAAPTTATTAAQFTASTDASSTGPTSSDATDGGGSLDPSTSVAPSTPTTDGSTTTSDAAASSTATPTTAASTTSTTTDTAADSDG